MARDDEVVDELVFGALHFDCVLDAPAFFESFQGRDPAARVGPVGAALVDDHERVTM